MAEQHAGFLSAYGPECRYFAVPDAAEMHAWLRRLRLRAYAPGSHYKVADALGMRCADGGMLWFGGVNVECLDLRQTVHSEECAIAFMVTALGKAAAIHEGWVLGAPEHLTGPCDHPLADRDGQPCGNCRQQIIGLAASNDIPIHCLSLNGRDVVKTIGQLLPDDFQFEDFNPDAAASRNAARGTTAPRDPDAIIDRVLRRGPLTRDQVFTWLDQLESVDYASLVGQSVILGLDNGFYVAGVKVENAAYTGLNAMQAALGIATANFGKVRVNEIYALSKSRRPDMPSHDMIYPLSLPAIQGLNEFVAGADIPLSLFTENGDVAMMHYADATDCFSNFAIQAYHIRDGILRAA